MDLKGSLVDTNVRIYASEELLEFLKTITERHPDNIANLVKSQGSKLKSNTEVTVNPADINLNKQDIKNLKKVKDILKANESDENSDGSKDNNEDIENDLLDDEVKTKTNSEEKVNEDPVNRDDEPYLTTTDIDWLYTYLKRKRTDGNQVPFLHELLSGVQVEMPQNKILKRNPILEERCVKLRAQQEAREYRKMTKGVDNVRMRFPEDSIAYQLKQVNRQLIAIGQFILSIFAGFLFGFKGVEWMIGSLDFGFRLLLGVMCALVIALAEIYFLAKKLNEELNVPETIQLGGPVKFVEEPTCHGHKIPPIDKQHQD